MLALPTPSAHGLCMASMWPLRRLCVALACEANPNTITIEGFQNFGTAFCSSLFILLNGRR